MKKPPEKPKSTLVFWLGCATVFFLLGLVAVGAGMFYMARRDFGGGQRSNVTALPVGWRDSVRELATVPAEGRMLAPARTDSGNAAVALTARELFSVWTTQRRLERGIPLQAEDSAMIDRIRSDTLVTVLARSARKRVYRVMDAHLAERRGNDQVYGVPVPGSFGFMGSTSIDALLLRAELRRREGKLADAEADARAVIGLGAMLVERGPSWFAVRAGRARIASGARVVEQVAVLRRDTATARAAARLAAWAGARSDGPSLFFLVMAHPDSALALAEDTTMPFPARADGLVVGAIGSTMRGIGSTITGPSADVMRRVRTLRASADDELARLAGAVDSALVRIDDVGTIGRLRWTFRRMER